jgi:iron(III) transport system ATP-binding protein
MSEHPMLSVQQLNKTYRLRKSRGHEEAAVSAVSFDVMPGELFTLLGPSGCGKTTTLRSVAGLERPDSGRIVVNGQTMFDSETKVAVPTNRRRLGMVFQSYAIWPHMSVRENVAFPLKVLNRRERPDRESVRKRVAAVLETTELAAFDQRSATQLSGGQQQRLALARALVSEPALLLLDEPLSNLDAQLRETMRSEIKRLQRDLGQTAIYVTHDQTEALAMSSRIAVMSKGRIQQIGTPREIYEAPRTQFVAQFVGTANLLTGTVARKAEGRFQVETDIGALWAQSCEGLGVGDAVAASIRPEYIELSVEEPPDAHNLVKGTVRTRSFLGDSMEHVVRAGQTDLRVKSHPGKSLPPGQDVYVSLDPTKLRCVAPD